MLTSIHLQRNHKDSFVIKVTLLLSNFNGFKLMIEHVDKKT